MDPCGFNLSISAIACAIAEGKSNNELAVLSAFFNQLGDSLETITAVRICNEPSDSDNKITQL